ncbi:MAG TPA: hypothetical protein VK747_11780 [Blastocatellia bacterium]|nr:hypothetical protein [Blastocatellia bacterium]
MTSYAATDIPIGATIWEDPHAIPNGRSSCSVLAVHVVTRFAVAELWHPEGEATFSLRNCAIGSGNDLAAVDMANNAISDDVKDPAA